MPCSYLAWFFNKINVNTINHLSGRYGLMLCNFWFDKVRTKEEIHRNLNNIKHDAFSISILNHWSFSLLEWTISLKYWKLSMLTKNKRPDGVKFLLFIFHAFNDNVFGFWKVNIGDCILLKSQQLRKDGKLTF